ncbi:MAG: ATP-binding protein [Candidatus Melainabacteria bacterium]|nr:ATP-binding protein [Candidatus Melainabacteria bacterium]
MIERELYSLIEKDSNLRQMSFVAGPRQIGKTTLAKELLHKHNCSEFYFNWDLASTRSNYRENSNFYSNNIGNRKKVWICFDEIHKLRKWKNILKEHFDKNEGRMKTIITGSARLDLFRKSGDSLAGRYFLYHLLPLTLSEISARGKNVEEKLASAIDFIELRISRKVKSKNSIDQLLRFSGFPEPFKIASEDFHTKWKKSYVDRLIYEDLREISQIQDLEKTALLIDLLPERIGALLSINSLSEDLEVNFRTAKNYLKALELTYILFFIKPYTKNISRSVRKEQKVYFYDWTRINNESNRFENYVACELFILVSFWNDSGYGYYDLNFIRTKDGKETDFLIIKDKKPWLLIEVKLASKEIKSHHITQAKYLGNIPVIQIVYEGSVIKRLDKNLFIISAEKFF